MDTIQMVKKASNSLEEDIRLFKNELHVTDSELNILYSNVETLVDEAISHFRIPNNDYKRIGALMEYVNKQYFEFVYDMVMAQADKLLQDNPHIEEETFHVTFKTLNRETAKHYISYFFKNIPNPAPDRIDQLLQAKRYVKEKENGNKQN